jgi:hypothetical protein
MPPLSYFHRGTAVQVVMAILSLLLLALTFWYGSGVYHRRYNVPDLTYEILPKFQFQGGSFAGVKVENKGRATAHEVVINLGELHTNVQQYDVQSSELWKKELGGTATGTLVLSLERMTSGSSLTIYLLTDDQAQLDHLAIAADEGPAHLAADGAIAQLALLVAPLAGLIVAAISASIGFVVVGFKSISTIRMRSRASETFLDYENRLVTQDIEVQRLKRELQEWRSGRRMLPPRAGG